MTFPLIFNEKGDFELGDWARFSSSENEMIGLVLSENANHTLQKAHFLKTLFVSLKNEIGFTY